MSNVPGSHDQVSRLISAELGAACDQGLYVSEESLTRSLMRSSEKRQESVNVILVRLTHVTLYLVWPVDHMTAGAN